MAISVFDLFKIGIGPSSSHTVGPMRAARKFVVALQVQHKLAQVSSIRIELYGSLAATGIGHGTDKALLLGLEGEQPEHIDASLIEDRMQQIRSSKSLNLLQQHSITFTESDHLRFYPDKTLPFHSNALQLSAFDEKEETLFSNIYYSIGGGFVVEASAAKEDVIHADDSTLLPFPFRSMVELLKICEHRNISVSQLMMENEKAWRSEGEIRRGLLEIWQVMQDCIQTGCETEGILPGGLNIRRRAAGLHKKLCGRHEQALVDPLSTLDWVNLYAIAVN